jgi:hypothetical protein
MVNRQRERRRIQRIHTLQPIIARIGAKRVAVVDLSLTGAKVAHEDSIGRVTESCVLEFDWDGHKIALRAEIRRTQIQRSANPSASRTIFHSGLRFIEAIGDSGKSLRSYVEDQVMRALDEHKANARAMAATGPQLSVRGPSTLIRHEIPDGVWNGNMPNASVPEARQEVGFAIAGSATSQDPRMFSPATRRAG